MDHILSSSTKPSFPPGFLQTVYAVTFEGFFVSVNFERAFSQPSFAPSPLKCFFNFQFRATICKVTIQHTVLCHPYVRANCFETYLKLLCSLLTAERRTLISLMLAKVVPHRWKPHRVPAIHSRWVMIENMSFRWHLFLWWSFLCLKKIPSK
jgi:hypothetical protein